MNEQTDKTIIAFLEQEGKNRLVLWAVEEMAELTKALMKDINRNKDNRDKVFEEVADVYIMLEYMKKIYNFSDREIWDYLNEKSQIKIYPHVKKWQV